MTYRYRSRIAARRLAKKSRTNFIISILIIGFLIYATLQWFLPTLINGLGSIRSIVKPSQKNIDVLSNNSSLAPPVLNIPYEATNTTQISISGYATPNSKVEIFLDDKLKDTVDVSDDGSFTFKNISLILGTNNIYGKSIDDKNQESLPSKTFKITFDNEKPTLNISEPEDGKNIQGGDRKVKIAGNTRVGAQVFINGNQIIVDKDGNFSSDQSLNDGDNNFDIKALDSASNTAEISRRVTYKP